MTPLVFLIVFNKHVAPVPIPGSPAQPFSLNLLQLVHFLLEVVQRVEVFKDILPVAKYGALHGNGEHGKKREAECHTRCETCGVGMFTEKQEENYGVK